MERRHFIQQTSTGLAGLLLSNELLAFTGKFDGQKINVGIIGCGSRGVGLMHVLKELEDKFQVTAICDILDIRFREAKEVVKQKVNEYKDYRKLLDDKSVQAVVIATPLYLHYKMAAD